MLNRIKCFNGCKSYSYCLREMIKNKQSIEYLKCTDESQESNKLNVKGDE